MLANGTLFQTPGHAASMPTWPASQNLDSLLIRTNSDTYLISRP